MSLSIEQQRNKIRQHSDYDASFRGDTVKRVIGGEIVYLTHSESAKRKPNKGRGRPPWIKSKR